MATQITNQATLNYTSGTNTLTASSNLATVTMQGPLEITKESLEQAYQIGEIITYNVFITNTSATALTNITVEDDLGTYAFNATTNVTPLTYVGPAALFVNNVFVSPLTGTYTPGGDSVSFTIASLAAGSTAMLQYNAMVNEYAGAIVGTSQISNIVSATATGFTTPIVATNTIPVASYANVEITKSMSPDPVVDGSTLTYTFVINNYGTIPATNVTLLDIFNPDPAITSVTVNGVATTEYSYATGTFQYPATGSTVTYTIPAATYTQNTTTGVVTVVPGTSTIVVTGTI